jgi:hypothetical protein
LLLLLLLQVLAAGSLGEISTGSVDWVTALPTIVANLHDYFVSVAAKLERLHFEVTDAASLSPSAVPSVLQATVSVTCMCVAPASCLCLLMLL